MKRIFASINVADVLLFKTLLEGEGIECITRNEQLNAATGSWGIPTATPELWVTNDGDEARANERLHEWRDKDAVALEPWVCPQCGETNEGQFGACWKCGYEIDEY